MTREEKSNLLNELLEYEEKNDIGNLTRTDRREFQQWISEALEQEPKRGHWISHREHCENLGVMPSGLGAYEWCSNCDCGIDVREWYRNHYNYCPNCGAKMESEVT